jgi:hypothetical protein
MEIVAKGIQKLPSGRGLFISQLRVRSGYEGPYKVEYPCVGDQFSIAAAKITLVNFILCLVL